MNVLEKLNQSTGNGPPKDVKPSELLRRLMDSKRPSEVLPFPRLDQDGKPLFEYAMQVLTQEELDLCYANAEGYTRRLLKDRATASGDDVNSVKKEAWSEIYDTAKCIEVLWSAMRDKDDQSKHLFMLSSDIRRNLTIDECTLLFRTYEAVQFRYGPLWSMLSDEDVEAWVSRLTEGVDNYPLEQLGQGALTQLVISLAYHLRVFKIDIGSFGQPSEDGVLSDTQSPSPQVEASQ